MSSLIFITGPMFAGKSTLSIRKLKYLLRRKKKIILFKPWIDNRISKDYFNCHNLIHYRAHPIKRTADVLSILKQHKVQPDFVFFDEINFFSPDLIEVIQKIRHQKITVICSGLTKDFKNKDFLISEKLSKIASKIIYRFAGCYRCFKKAGMSQRLVKNDKLILVGGSESYAPVCSACYS